MSGRRRVLRVVLGVGALAATGSAFAQAAAVDLDSTVRAFTGGAQPKPGRVKLDIAQLVENGNVVPITVDVESPMTPADHVKRIAVFNEKNPQRDVGVFTLGPRSGKARIATRIRLSTSQRLVAIAQMSDGSYWQDDASVIVTIAACIEG